MNDDGTFDVKYEDGDSEKSVSGDLISAVASAREFKEGQKVKAPFQSKGDLYAGKIVKDNGDGTYEVLFDDGDVDGAVRLIRAVEEDQASAKKSDEATPPEASEPDSADAHPAAPASSKDTNKAGPLFSVGQAIEARHGGKKKFYPGTISGVNDDGTFDVRYEDGDSEKSVSGDLISAVACDGDFKEGQKVKAPFQSKGDLYAGKIVKDNGDGTYEVLFDDGDVDGAVRLIRAVEEDQASAKKSDEATPPEASEPDSADAHPAASASSEDTNRAGPLFSVGQAIETRHGGKKKFYPGTISGVNDDGTFDVKYEDGDSEKSVSGDLISAVACAGDFKEGQKVKAPFQSKGDLYAGKIVKDNGDGTYEVLFDDGDVDGAVRLIRAVEEDQASAKKSDEATPPEASEPDSADAHPAASASSEDTNRAGPLFSVGQAIEARHGGKKKFYPGTISGVNDDGTFDVKYEDGDSEKSVLET